MASTIGYDSSTQSAVLQPQAALATETLYTALIRGGSSGVRDLAGNTLAADYGWTFMTKIARRAGAGRRGTGPGGRVLVITSSSRPFSTYYTEILRAEGLNAFATATVDSYAGRALAARCCHSRGDAAHAG